MKDRLRIPHHCKVRSFTYWKSFKIQWYTFWRNWHQTKFFYYNSSRHLLKTRKYRHKLRKAKKMMIQYKESDEQN